MSSYPSARTLVASSLALAAASCTGAGGGPGLPADTNFGYTVTGEVDNRGATGPEFCALPMASAVPGAAVPEGLCLRKFADLRVPRSIAFAPNGDLFVAAPSTATAGGATGGPGAIVLFTDSDRDGRGEPSFFASGLPDVHGLALRGDWLYFTTGDAVFRTPYRAGQRVEEAARRERLGVYERLQAARWTHGVAVSAGGAVLTTQGVYSSQTCPDTPREGAVLRVTPGAPTLEPVAAGFRNPMYLRCHPTEELCLTAELGDDGGASFGAREKIVRIRPDTNYGFPCCSGRDVTTPYNVGNRYNCGQTTAEEAMFPLNDTPFGLDWEPSRWPEPFRNGLFVALHGSFYSTPAWAGARIVFAATDSARVPTGAWRDVVRGFGPGGASLDRPSDVAFAPDGRLFFADDQGHALYWLAPAGLRMPTGG